MNLILGTANFGNSYGKRLERKECFAIMNEAKRLGVWALDTAPSYGESEDIIAEWLENNKMLVFSKASRNMKNKIGDIVLLHDENEVKNYNKFDGVSLYSSVLADNVCGWIQAPFNPLNLEFLPYCRFPHFIARSIFIKGRLDGDRETIAKLTFGFLSSHGVKNCVFGVESVQELRMNVAIARDINQVDTRKF